MSEAIAIIEDAAKKELAELRKELRRVEALAKAEGA